ncbi:hypothetical protein RI054_18g83900 [Pseudoscourfieldia marina]
MDSDAVDLTGGGAPNLPAKVKQPDVRSLRKYLGVAQKSGVQLSDAEFNQAVAKARKASCAPNPSLSELEKHILAYDDQRTQRKKRKAQDALPFLAPFEALVTQTANKATTMKATHDFINVLKDRNTYALV